MNTHYSFPPDSLCDPGVGISFSSNSTARVDSVSVGTGNRSPHVLPSSFMIRTAIRISRARWFSFLRRVYHYQNSTRSDLGSNPFNSKTWMMLEFVALLVQISITTFTLAVSAREKPIWPMRMWIIGYNVGCVLSLVPLFGRYRQIYVTTQEYDFSLPVMEQHRANEEPSYNVGCVLSLVPLFGRYRQIYVTTQEYDFSLPVMEQHRANEEPRSTNLMNKCRTSLELFFAIWFVMGNVWVFDSRFGSLNHAPKLHVLCISLLGWNAACYSFPFLLFLLLCCCVPLISNLLGYNMNMGSVAKGASDDQISELPSWKYTEADHLEVGDKEDDPECCICLEKYRDKEEVRQLPCSHKFHLKCVDQWLRIISCCPLCKKGLHR